MNLCKKGKKKKKKKKKKMSSNMMANYNDVSDQQEDETFVDRNLRRWGRWSEV